MVTALNAAIKNYDMNAVSKASASAGAKQRGIVIACNIEIYVFRNDFAVSMSAASIKLVIEAALRFNLTDDGDGTAILTYRTPTGAFAPYGNATLNDVAGELDAIFATISEQAVWH